MKEPSNTCQYGGRQFWVNQLVIFCPSAFVGGTITGFITKRQGLIHGLLCVLFFLGFMFLFSVWAFHWVASAKDILYEWVGNWWLIIVMLLFGMTGGLLGQLLAQKWHRRSLKKPNASQSDN
jgi:hypothetical protein